MGVADQTVQIIPANSDGLPTEDSFILNGEECPGRCDLISGGAQYGWDERPAYGLSGGTLVPKGDPLNTYAFRINIWAGSQWAAFKSFAARFLSSGVKYQAGTTTPRALGIYHPVLSAPPLSVTEVVVDHVTAATQDEDGMWTCEVHFKQYRKPVLVGGKADAVISPMQNTQPTAPDKASAEFAAALGSAAALAGSLFGQ